eukprot:gene267-350_t
MLGQVQAMQSKIQEIQQKVAQLQATGESGAGLVQATVGGNKKLLKLKIDPSIIQVDEQVMLQDLVIAAVNKALEGIENKTKDLVQSHTAAQFLAQVIEHSHPYRVVVIDNGSTDESVAWLTMQFPHICCIQLAKNEGFAGGYNLGLQQIQAAYYILLNNDVLVTSHWIAPMLELMEETVQIAACQPKIRSYTHPEKFDYAGAAGGFIDWMGYPFCRGRLFSCIEEDGGQYDEHRPIFWASGACVCVRASAFWEVGGFDATLFAYYEEIDLCWRMQQQGSLVYYCGQSTVYHLGSATVGTESPLKTYWNFRNRALVLYKNTPMYLLGWRQLVRVTLDVVAALQAVLQGKWKHSLAILRAQVDFFKLAKAGQPKMRNQKMKYIYQGSTACMYIFS